MKWCKILLLFTCSVMSVSLWPYGLQHARLPYLLSTPGTYSDSWSSSQWCHPTILSSVIRFLSCLQSFSASGSFQMSHFFTSGGQYWTFSFNVSPSNGYSRLISFRIDWADLLTVKRTLKSLFQHTVQKHQFFSTQLSSQSNSHIHTWPQEKKIALTRRTFVGKVMSLLFNMPSRLVITFLPRNKCLLISWLQSP